MKFHNHTSCVVKDLEKWFESYKGTTRNLVITQDSLRRLLTGYG